MDGTGGAFFGEEQRRSREAFVPAFLVEGIFMRTLTFPLRAPRRGPQLQGWWWGVMVLGAGRGQYPLHIAAKEAPVL